MKKIALSLFIILNMLNTAAFAQNNTENKSNENVAFIKKTIAYHTALLLPAVTNTYRYINIEKFLNENCTKIEDKNILNFIQKACCKITDKKINVYVEDENLFDYTEDKDDSNKISYFALTVGNNNIVINPNYYDTIEKYFTDTNDINPKEKNDALNIFNFLIQHEAGHIKNNDSRSKLIKIIIGSIIKSCLFEISKKLYNFKCSQLITFFSLNIITALIQAFLARKAEESADMGVVGKDAIEGGKLLFNDLINLKKNNPKVNIAIKLDLSHPSPEQRLSSLEKRTT